MKYIFPNKTYLCHKYFNEAVHLLSALFMQAGSVWGFLPRNRFKDTISFSGTGMFYDGIFFQKFVFIQKLHPFHELFLSNQSFSGIVFVKPILFRNCFCQTSPFQEWFSQKLSFDVSFEQKNYMIPIKSEVLFIACFFRKCHVWHCLVPSPSHTILFQELSFLTLPFSKPIAYRPLSGTVMSDTACFTAGQCLMQCKKCF